MSGKYQKYHALSRTMLAEPLDYLPIQLFDVTLLDATSLGLKLNIHLNRL